MTVKNRSKFAVDAESFRVQLAGKSGPAYWRSLDELAQSDAFREYVENEFPDQAAAPADALTRRNFLQVMGATLALAGVSGGCARQPNEKIYPYVKAPEEVVPGKPLYFASAHVEGGYGKGILVESHMGRPTKVEGLPGHPATDGATDAHMQASILDLYDPDRSQSVMHRGELSTWDRCVVDMNGVLDTLRPRGGEGVHLLTGTVTSPSQARMLSRLLGSYPNARWHQYEPMSRDNVREGIRRALGDTLEVIYHFDRADRIVTLDADIFSEGPANIRHMLDYASRRSVIDGARGNHPGGADGDSDGDHAVHTPPLNRMYAVECTPTLAGASADHRLSIRPGQMNAVAQGLAAAIGVDGASVSVDDSESIRTWIAAAATDLAAHRGRGIVIAGENQPPEIHALAYAMNDLLGNVGSTVTTVATPEARPVNQLESLRDLVADLNADRVELLLILGQNPVYATPADLDFAAAVQRAKTVAQLGRYLDETSDYAHWHVPELHPLETWGDVRAYDGSVLLIQPLIAPLYGGKSTLEFISALVDDAERSAHDIVQANWRSAGADSWQIALSQGFIEDPGAAWSGGEVSFPAAQRSGRTAPRPAGTDAVDDGDGFDICFRPDPTVGDGSYCNNAWMQELPKSLTKVTWDNAVYISPVTAGALGLENEDRVRVTYRERSVEGAVWKQPGHPQNSITVHFGYGRPAAGKVGRDMGFNAYSIWTSDTAGFGRGARIEAIGGKYALACTEGHYAMENRGLVRHFSQETFNGSEHPAELVTHGEHHEFHTAGEDETLFRADWQEWHGNKWGMTIDLNKCVGCNACITACQSENIIPCVGKTEVRKGREMHWIRLDRYYTTGSTWHSYLPMAGESESVLENPNVYFQPLPCMQCENAPCEVVCPVGATQHSREGLNDMVYNRCIGTRYCSNNCPYKVRRFNFFNYSKTPLGSRGDRVTRANINWTHKNPESLKPMRNPDVTVRGRGVMEKCTYCVQRINLQRIEDKKNGRVMYDESEAAGPVDRLQTACQQACPTRAITFGNLNDPESAVAVSARSPRNYGILTELNTRPRTTYLARLTNPNPELDGVVGS